MYGMRRTTVYLPDELKRAIERAADESNRSEAQFIRSALERAVNDLEPPKPRLPLFASNDPTLAEHVDESLAGFGES
jgi:CopG-like RHH_1 or ribbon-helix-helix domain, RHH_5